MSGAERASDACRDGQHGGAVVNVRCWSMYVPAMRITGLRSSPEGQVAVAAQGEGFEPTDAEHGPAS
jgi:hypothetical protein